MWRPLPSYPAVGSLVFFFNDTATTEIYTLSLHDALPISAEPRPPFAGTVVAPLGGASAGNSTNANRKASRHKPMNSWRSEEHTSELQSRQYLVCRLLLEKKKKTQHNSIYDYKPHANLIVY